MSEDASGIVSHEAAASDWAPRKLSREAGKMEQRLYWSRKSIPERLAAMTELTRRMYKMRGIDLDERKTDFTVSRVRRRQG
jgi:hypothetical protein